MGRVQKQLNTASGSFETLRTVETQDALESKDVLELPEDEGLDEPNED